VSGAIAQGSDPSADHKGVSTIQSTHLRLVSTVKARRTIATLNLAILIIFVSAELFFSYFRFPTPRFMFLVAVMGMVFPLVELGILRTRSELSHKASRIFAGASIGWNLGLPFLLAATTRQFHTHYFGLLIQPVLEAALFFSLPVTLAISCVASACVLSWVGYAADFKPPYQLGELLEATTLILLYLIVGPLIWWLVDLLGHREEQLRQRLLDLEQAKARLVEGEKLAAVGRLASGLAHEIRNPVAIISSALEASTSDAFSAEDRMEMSRVAVAEARRLERLTSDFLTYAQPGIPSFDRVDAIALVGYILSIARAQALNRRITFNLLTDGDCLLYGNEGQLQQALLNLLLNAVDASPDFGHITVQVKPCAKGIWIAIENEGPAIPAEAVPQIFEPFFTAKRGGTGLGLAIARSIAEKHGGDLILERNEEERILFALTLPSVPSKVAPVAKQERGVLHGTHPGR
jgi:signal transduction histidine kinase